MKPRTKDIQLQMTWDNDPNPQLYDRNSTFGAVEKIHKYFNDTMLIAIAIMHDPYQNPDHPNPNLEEAHQTICHPERHLREEC